MSVTIQDDMWRSAEAMPGKQGEAFLLSLIRYGFTGEEPKPSSKFYPSFVLCKDRMSMSAAASTKGRKMAEARWGKQNAQAQTKHDASASDKHHAQASSMHDAQEQPEQDAEVSRGEVSRGEVSRGEVSRGENASTDASELSAQVAEVIAHLNAVCGTSYRPGSETARKHVGARIGEGFSVDDCKKVIDNMAAEWLDDPKMRQFLRPTTLFRKEKFESYLNRIGEVQGNDEYAEYERERFFKQV